MDSIENSDSDTHKVCEDSERKSEIIERDLSAKNEFVSLISVSQRPMNDCK